MININNYIHTVCGKPILADNDCDECGQVINDAEKLNIGRLDMEDVVYGAISALFNHDTFKEETEDSTEEYDLNGWDYTLVGSGKDYLQADLAAFLVDAKYILIDADITSYEVGYEFIVGANQIAPSFDVNGISGAQYDRLEHIFEAFGGKYRAVVDADDEHVRIVCG